MDFIPEVVMDFIPDEKEDAETEELNPNMVYEDDDEIKEKVKEIIQEVKTSKEDIKPEEIFNLPSNPEISSVNANGTEAVAPAVRLTKKGKPFKKRPPMSDAHKEKLKVAREKAVAVRRANAQKRKEDKDLDKKRKELQRKKKVKEVQELEEDIEDRRPPPPTPTPQNSPPQKSVDDAVMEGIMKYEIIRKQRKKEKQEAMKIQREEEEVKEKLRRAINPPKAHNPFAGCY